MLELTKAEKRAEKAENLDAFSGLKLKHIKKNVASILALIGRYEIFDEYTKHDISHINQLLELTEWVIPDKTKEEMTKTDWLMLVLAIYFHDLGMLVTKEEFNRRNSTDFIEYKGKIIAGDLGVSYKEKVKSLINENEDKADHFLYQEYIRMHHAERIKYWVQGKVKQELGISDKVVEEIDELLKPLPPKFRIDLGVICESHHLSDLDNLDKYRISFPYGKTSEEYANMQYVSIILRTVDLLHITADRTPSIEFKIISPTDPISQIEWIKQKAVSNVRSQIKLNKEGKPDTSIQSDTIEVTAFFDNPEKAEAFFSLISYLTYARKQIEQSHRWAEKGQKDGGSSYLFPWKDLNDNNVQTEGFERELFSFYLDQNKILNLLVGHTLYNDTTVVLRELIQNSIDAIRFQKFLLKGESQNEHQIVIKWDSVKRILEIVDTGTGMDRYTIKNHLLKVGASKYQEDTFKKTHPDFSPISRFGIGVLTCFLISDDIIIKTITTSDSEAISLTIKNVDGKYLLRNEDRSKLDKGIKKHGSQFILQVRPEINMQNIEKDIKKWILFPPCTVSLIVDAKPPIEIGFKSPKNALEFFLKNSGYEINDSLKVEETSLNGVVMAYAISHSSYFQEWEFIKVSEKHYDLNPIGTAVEGIRVESDTPGFKGQRLIAVANASGKNAPKTNVARSLIEDTTEKNTWLSTIYTIYANHIKNEQKQLQEKKFSLTWAANETTYLLSPFFDTRDSDQKSKVADINTFNKAIERINGVVIEINQNRTVESPNYLKGENKIVTIDCDLYRSAESMLKEVPTKASLSNMIAALYGDQKSDFNTKELILCGYKPENVLHQLSLENKEVVELRLFHDQRRVDLVWENKTSNNVIWKNLAQESQIYRSRRLVANIFLQQRPISLIGLKDEIAIGAFGSTYLLMNSEISQFILKYVKPAAEEKDIDKLALRFILEIIQRYLSYSVKDTTKEKYEQDINLELKHAESLELKDNIWDILDKNELINACLSTKWKSFDTLFWKSRRWM